jgi:hypothetical protein
LKKGDIRGFALARLGEIPPSPFYKGGNIIYGQTLIITFNLLEEVMRRNFQKAPIQKAPGRFIFSFWGLFISKLLSGIGVGYPRGLDTWEYVIRELLNHNHRRGK